MSKPTPLAVLPKPEFIANIDTANEEVVRLVGLYNIIVSPEGRLMKAEADLEAANALLAGAVKPEDLQAAKDAQAKAEKERDEFKSKVDGAVAASVQAAAAAGVEQPAKVKGTNALEADQPAKSTATGLQRAIEANIAIHAAKKAK